MKKFDVQNFKNYILFGVIITFIVLVAVLVFNTYTMNKIYLSSFEIFGLYFEVGILLAILILGIIRLYTHGKKRMTFGTIQKVVFVVAVAFRDIFPNIYIHQLKDVGYVRIYVLAINALLLGYIGYIDDKYYNQNVLKRLKRQKKYHNRNIN